MPRHDDPITALACEAQLLALLARLMREIEDNGDTRMNFGPAFAEAEDFMRSIDVDWRVLHGKPQDCG